MFGKKHPVWIVWLVLLAGVGGFSACRKNETRVIKSIDGRFQMTVPGGWKEDRTLHEDAELQASHRGSNMYVIVLAEPKEDLHEMTLQRHSDITRDGLKESIVLQEETGPTELTIDGFPAIQYVIRAAKEHVNIVYLHTTVESPTHFYQILAWTIPSRYQKDPETIRKVTEYFHEIKG